MEPQHGAIWHLLDKIENSTATAEECDQLLEWVNSDQSAEVISYINRYYEEQGLVFPEQDGTHWKAVFDQIVSVDKEVVTEPFHAPIRRIHSLRRWSWVAASIILVVAMGTYFWFQRGKNAPPAAQAQIIADVQAPQSVKAVLTLSDGTRIAIDSLTALKQNNVVISKTEDGRISYQQLAVNSQHLTAYNTLSNPRGSKVIDITLSDGSQIWLNAGSAITYPAVFTGKERKVTVTGEVYIKVAKNPAQPFIASVNGMDVQALGTEFDIEAYGDEERISTTLIDGSVRVSNNKQKVLLKPGEQTQLAGGNLSASRKVNTEEVTGWKAGFFHFESADLKTILRQFARWYDIEVVYEGAVTDRKFFGIVKRSNTLDKVLDMLQDNNIKFRIEGKTLIVKSD
jgi:ferric-dicitrate binding protein FerR (iron transport regulator)